MSIRRGTVERMTGVSAHERMKARIRKAMQVVRYWMVMPEAKDNAIGTVSLQTKVERTLDSKKKKQQTLRI